MFFCFLCSNPAIDTIDSVYIRFIRFDIRSSLFDQLFDVDDGSINQSIRFFFFVEQQEFCMTEIVMIMMVSDAKILFSDQKIKFICPENFSVSFLFPTHMYRLFINQKIKPF